MSQGRRNVQKTHSFPWFVRNVAFLYNQKALT